MPDYMTEDERAEYNRLVAQDEYSAAEADSARRYRRAAGLTDKPAPADANAEKADPEEVARLRKLYGLPPKE
ncbi:MAG TPA: hypothetical protein VFC78_11085 [Tepidisphaeraceae bacterium]|nr:hypothetical protein [Tepidisphaeraceae bacterium]